jgi:dihydroneopterin aldolase
VSKQDPTDLPPASPTSPLPRENTGRILIRSLELSCLIGVPDSERMRPQRLLLDLSLEPECSFAAMRDEISRTVDYANLAAELVDLAASKPRKLIETLAVDLAVWTFRSCLVSALSLRIRKFILPNTEFVGVSLDWTREDFARFLKQLA